jgi:hypothetical protein
VSCTPSSLPSLFSPFTSPQLEDEVRTQEALSSSQCEELLALSTAHGELKQAYFKMEAESKQHDQLVHIVQQELAEMSYFAAAGRVALGLCHPDETQMVSGAVVVTPTHSGAVPSHLAAGFGSSQASAAEQEEAKEHNTQQANSSSRSRSAGGSGRSCGGSSRPSQLATTRSSMLEDTTAVCIAAAAAAGAAAAIAANPGSPRAALVAQAAAPATATAREALLRAAGDSSVADAAGAAVVAAAVEAARVTAEAENKADNSSGVALE